MEIKGYMCIIYQHKQVIISYIMEDQACAIIIQPKIFIKHNYMKAIVLDVENREVNKKMSWIIFQQGKTKDKQIPLQYLSSEIRIKQKEGQRGNLEWLAKPSLAKNGI